jgi:MYXO-CTERM domain-containing protein
LSSRFVDATSGAVIGTAATAVASPSTAQLAALYRGSLAFDGSSFLATWLDQNAARVRGARIDTNNVVLDASGFDVNEDRQYEEAIGSASWGRSLVAYYENDATTLSSLVVGRFYDNPLGAGVTASSFVCPSGGSGSGGNGAGGASGGGSNVGLGGSAGTSIAGGTSGALGIAGALATGGTSTGGSGTGGSGTGIAGSEVAGEPNTSGAGNSGEAGANADSGGTSSSSGGALQGSSGAGVGSSRAGSSDAGATDRNAGNGNGAANESSGCGCKIAAQPESAKPFWLAGLLVTLLARRRPRKVR